MLFLVAFIEPTYHLNDIEDQVEGSYRPSYESRQNNLVNDVVGYSSEHGHIPLQSANESPAKRDAE